MSHGWLKGVVESGSCLGPDMPSKVALLSPCFPQAPVITSQQGHLTSSNSPEVSGAENKPGAPTTAILTSLLWAEITCGQVVTSWSYSVGPLHK